MVERQQRKKGPSRGDRRERHRHERAAGTGAPTRGGAAALHRFLRAGHERQPDRRIRCRRFQGRHHRAEIPLVPPLPGEPSGRREAHLAGQRRQLHQGADRPAAADARAGERPRHQRGRGLAPGPHDHGTGLQRAERGGLCRHHCRRQRRHDSQLGCRQRRWPSRHGERHGGIDARYHLSGDVLVG